MEKPTGILDCLENVIKSPPSRNKDEGLLDVR